jgi:hypothetical protein
MCTINVLPKMNANARFIVAAGALFGRNNERLIPVDELGLKMQIEDEEGGQNKRLCRYQLSSMS